MRHIAFFIVCVQLAASTLLLAAPTERLTKQSDGVILRLPLGVLRLQVMSDTDIHVTYAKGATLPEQHSYSVVARPVQGTRWRLIQTESAITIKTSVIQARVERKTGAVTFLDGANQTLLAEMPDGRDIEPSKREDAQGLSIQQDFALAPGEGIYGLGQHQQGVWNYRGHSVTLLQKNMEVGIPVMLSSKGYTVLWDNPSVTKVDVGVASDVVRWASEVGSAIDYYFIYGGSAEASLSSYRSLTGEAPLMPEWMFGLWQSKERYRTQEELLSIAQRYRELKVPIDGIVQDWRYWPDNTWGSHQFDATRYPDPSAMTRALHDMGFHMLISVWAKFDLGTDNFNQLEQAGALFDPVIPYVFPPGKGKWYDPFSAKGRELYWKQVSTKLFSKGVDGWWLDAPEPELSGHWGEFRTFRTSAGPGAAVFNAYPLLHSTGIYQGQRAQTDVQRVVILTRSAYAGQQRNAAITWSGDIGSSWKILREQVPAGLNFSVSGIPYWNTDIGGFGGVPNPSDTAYAEIFARWFEFGSFCPMFRVHGSAPQGGTGIGKEFWRFDAKTQSIWRTYDELRYRLMPYTYSVAWQVTHEGATIMRPLVMHYAQDENVLNIGDQYLYGPSIMVNPVTDQGATSRSVYLPGPTRWYDFWTGESQAGGRTIKAGAPIETMPLYVPAGSILPVGPRVQFTGEKAADPIELRIYPGADAAFTLYEDERDTYHYEHGVYATILMEWNESTHTLKIGQRKGSFPGMQKERSFNIVLVSPGHGAGLDEVTTPERTLRYSGRELSIKLAQ